MNKYDDEDNRFYEAVYNLYIENFNLYGYLYFSDEYLLFDNFNSKQQDNIEIIKEYLKNTGYRKNIQKINYLIDAFYEKVKGCKQASKCIYDAKKYNFVVINNIADYLNFLKRLPPSNGERFFRGQANFNWNLCPSIYRHLSFITNEKIMMDRMLQANPDEFNFSTTFDILSKLQHYNLPTRLIDVTINPLVALFFAVNDDIRNEDGQIFVFSPEQNKVKYTDSDTVSILSNISKMDIDFGNNDIGTDNILRFLHFIRKEKPFFENFLTANCLNNYVFVQGNYNNKRIAKQNGAFILVGVQDSKLIPAQVSSDCIINGRSVKIIIPYKSKIKIKKDLELLSIHDGTLFPEIDSVAKHIKNNVLGY